MAEGQKIFLGSFFFFFWQTDTISVGKWKIIWFHLVQINSNVSVAFICFSSHLSPSSRHHYQQCDRIRTLWSEATRQDTFWRVEINSFSDMFMRRGFYSLSLSFHGKYIYLIIRYLSLFQLQRLLDFKTLEKASLSCKTINGFVQTFVDEASNEMFALFILEAPNICSVSW